MAEKVGLMVEHTLDAFVERDLAAIERLCGPEEQAVDELEQAVLHASLARLRSGDVAPEVAVYQVLAARCLERAGDHCTDIAEWIRYSESGIYEELA
jgi:phosphate transport system protein